MTGLEKFSSNRPTGFEPKYWAELVDALISVRSQGIGQDVPLPYALSCGNKYFVPTEALHDQLMSKLPEIAAEIERKRMACKEELDKLGHPCGTLDEQRCYLLQISESFQQIARSAIDGIWNDPFFATDYNADEEDSIYHGRLRAGIQYHNRHFFNIMSEKDQRREIASGGEDSEEKNIKESGGEKFPDPIRVTRNEFVEYIRHERAAKLRGSELPGVLNPLIVGELFREQSAPWEKITQEHVKAVWLISKRFMHLAIHHVAVDDAETAEAIF
ncbi:P-loop containing nucleoside triphosphate hydrolase protein [Apiospora arundinis]|uniref:P-loop containing nucleoside triphosphate hydrolase protein n=1 Tax=Apiospora arundinis TaxID=335852 RepID=A0ABR2HKC3_9PEZI